MTLDYDPKQSRTLGKLKAVCYMESNYIPKPLQKAQGEGQYQLKNWSWTELAGWGHWWTAVDYTQKTGD